MTEREPRPAGLILDAQLHLLDRQVIDNDGEPVCTVDDVEIEDVPWGKEIPPGTRPPVISSLLTGPVLATRIFGGRPPTSRLERIPWRDVADIGTLITLGIASDQLDLTWTERWVREHIIGRIPGGRHDAEPDR